MPRWLTFPIHKPTGAGKQQIHWLRPC